MVRRLLLILLALSAAGFTAFFARSWVSAERAALLASVPEQTAQTAAVMVLVAKETLAAGTFVRPQHLRWQPWPEEGVAEGYAVKGARRIKDFEGAVVRASVNAGEPLTEQRVVHPGDRGFLAAVLEPGMRAVSVPVNATSGISGFVFPGDWVDVILTVRLTVKSEDGKDSQTRYFSETLLQDVRVLAIDQTVENAEGQAQVAKTATLEVTPKQAEKISLGLEMGDLSLSLRSLARETAGAANGEMVNGAEGPSFTMDTDIYYPSGLVGGGVPKAHVNVLRGDKAEQSAF